ncbi:hypothetical protein GLYMA_15G189650v4 [Glycine max]|nr:hypothetical protein GLYMA_15G189650v4 [Glycine max]
MVADRCPQSWYVMSRVCWSSKQDFGKNGSFNSNILTPTINYGCHLHSFGTSITDIALHSSGIKSERDISGLCAMSRCFPFPPPGYTNKGYEKKAITEDVELLTKDHSQGNFIWRILSLPIQFHCP